MLKWRRQVIDLLLRAVQQTFVYRWSGRDITTALYSASVGVFLRETKKKRANGQANFMMSHSAASRCGCV